MAERVDKVQYLLTLSQHLYCELQEMAEERGTTVAELMRKGIQWQLLLGSVKEKEGRVLIERSKGAELEIITF